MIHIQPASSHHIQEVLGWLKTERDELGEGFYCNRNFISESFATGDGLCAVADDEIVGFAVFQMFTDGGDLRIVEVKSVARRRGIGSKLVLGTVEAFRQLGAKYVDVECTSPEGEQLCRRHGFEDYVDPRNYRNEWDNPTLRLYLSAWRPRPPNPWA